MKVGTRAAGRRFASGTRLPHYLQWRKDEGAESKRGLRSGGLV
ncbi:MAG: hypothetical protein ACLR3P_05405 [Hungatella sp.]|nr:hypothetical protein [Hungatella effluvii]